MQDHSVLFQNAEGVLAGEVGGEIRVEDPAVLRECPAADL